MLGPPRAPALDKYAKWQEPTAQVGYSEEAADAVYLASYDQPGEKKRQSWFAFRKSLLIDVAGTAV